MAAFVVAAYAVSYLALVASWSSVITSWATVPRRGFRVSWLIVTSVLIGIETAVLAGALGGQPSPRQQIAGTCVVFAAACSALIQGGVPS
ncbi:MAG TPA: hypothetical protein VFD32_15755 [Dehalococcoidia bacterium]|nr:hypothetical protein [Dehalococcoidia bacterium]